MRYLFFNMVSGTIGLKPRGGTPGGNSAPAATWPGMIFVQSSVLQYEHLGDGEGGVFMQPGSP